MEGIFFFKVALLHLLTLTTLSSAASLPDDSCHYEAMGAGKFYMTEEAKDAMDKAKDPILEEVEMYKSEDIAKDCKKECDEADDCKGVVLFFEETGAQKADGCYNTNDDLDGLVKEGQFTTEQTEEETAYQLLKRVCSSESKILGGDLATTADPNDASTSRIAWTTLSAMTTLSMATAWIGRR